MDLYFEDLAIGQVFETQGLTMTEAAIIDFALAYDPQTFHLDRDQAKKSEFAGLIASGFHTLAVSWRLFMNLGLVTAANRGGPGMDELRWLRPVMVGDTLRCKITVDEARPSRSKPDRGSVRWRFETFNQRGEQVMSAQITSLIARRGA